ncbi:MAG: site-specific integrase [Clostridia bacterium]|nr:site-specific integrase [Clostridia bacterium]
MTETLDLLMQRVESDLNKACLSFGFLKGYLADIPRKEPPNNNCYALATPTEEQMLIKLQVEGVSINRKPRADGRFQGYVTDDDGKHYFYGKTYEAVESKIREYLQGGKLQKKKALKRKNNSPKFGEYVKKWLDLYKKPNLKPTSLNSMQLSLAPALNAYGDKPINKITGDDVQGLLLSIQSPRMRDLCRLYLTTIFKKALVQELIKRNPCEAVEIKKHKAKHKNALTPTEQEKFFAVTSGTKYSLLYRFLTATGLRIGEALALRRSDVDFTKCMVNVSKNVVFIKGKRIEQDTPKTDAGNRIIPISKTICRELEQIQTEILFPYTYNAVHCAIQRVARNTGIPVTLHILRHTYATRLEEAGISPKMKQYLLGHASLEMTQGKYTDTQQHYVEALSDRIRKVFDT